MREDNYKLLVRPGPGEWSPDPCTSKGREEKTSSLWKEREGRSQGEVDSDMWPREVWQKERLTRLRKVANDEKMLFDISTDPEERCKLLYQKYLPHDHILQNQGKPGSLLTSSCGYTRG